MSTSHNLYYVKSYPDFKAQQDTAANDAKMLFQRIYRGDCINNDIKALILLFQRLLKKGVFFDCNVPIVATTSGSVATTVAQHPVKVGKFAAVFR